ncbi:hypothetical protein LTR37_003816 [Vermiconidia calcicola]|uniref:Uncharacterized protein n=1 Tax=Vermiconidia calcicola TaxID=1690605 RepID=A0ACC3NPW4_9PEZI|nr:hypothetical protein LTR37_003816 [Vermiconidia calcicola]
MDFLPDWIGQLAGNHEALRTYGPYARQAYSYISTIKSYLLPLIDQVSRKPDLATIALLLVILFVSLKILNMLWQTVMFWVRTVRGILFYGGLVALGLWMYTRGPEGVAADVQYWWSVWNQEHVYWRERERAARMMKQGLGSGGGAVRGGWF